MAHYHEDSPSLGEYFTWINNTNEGSCEAQTLVNLDYFRWMRDQYGLQLDLYAFDAGNLDGAEGTYGDPESPRFQANFPGGFAAVAGAAAQLGLRLGLWAGADGFGTTPEEEARRTEVFVSLCRDLNFGLFKFDTVCGSLRPEKRAAFARMLRACRQYCPDLIVLNHRNELGEAGEAATTRLWESKETYIDVHAFNEVCAPHHRASALTRGLPPEGGRLYEDHGVCLSSCLDYWQDELTVHLFARCLLLAPQLYGNPWLLRDEEQAQLGYLCALHRRYRATLTRVRPLEGYDVCRGTGDVRFVTLINPTWKERPVSLALSDLALAPGIWQARIESPFVRDLGPVGREAILSLAVPPFRAMLLHMERRMDFPAPQGADGRPLVWKGDRMVWALYGPPGSTAALRLSGDLSSWGSATLDGAAADALLRGESVTWRAPGNPADGGGFLGELLPCPVPPDSQALYEAAVFAADNDALELRTLRRSGETAVEAIRAAREAFFRQDTFVYRGIDSRYAWDGREDTFFCAATQQRDQRLQGGCLRIRLKVPSTDLRMTFLLEEGEEAGVRLDGSPDGKAFACGALRRCGETPCAYRFVPKQVPMPETRQGRLLILEARFAKPVRYVRVYNAPLRVVSIPGAEALSNLFAPCPSIPRAWHARLRLGRYPEGSTLCVALDGTHGAEGAYACLRVGDGYRGAPDRAPSYPCNPFEHYVRPRPDHYTYYFPITPDLWNREVEAYVLGMPWGEAAFTPRAYVALPETPLAHGTLILEKRASHASEL